MKLERIMQRLNVDKEKAKEILDLLQNDKNPEDYVSVQTWVRQCFNKPSCQEMKMEALNEILEGYGVEAIEMEGYYVNKYHFNIVATYVNMGDTYICTILYDTENEKYLLTSCGDFVEEWERKYGK